MTKGITTTAITKSRTKRLLRHNFHRRARRCRPSPTVQPTYHLEPLEARVLLSTTFTAIQSILNDVISFADWDNDGQVEWNANADIFADYDNDGHLDAYHYKNSQRLRHNKWNGIFQDQTSLLPTIPSTVSLGAAWGDFNGDGFVDLYVGGYEIWESQQEYPDTMLLNRGGKSFEIHWVQPSIRRARGISTADFDEDGDLDIYASNYRLQPNGLWVNDGKGNITDQAAARGATGGNSHTIGSAWGDIDNDGHFDIFVANFSHPGQMPAVFLRNGGPSSGYKFQQMRALSGSDWQESYASAALGDMDNDGDLDLYFTTVYGGDAPRMYRNDGNWNFVNMTGEVGLADRGSTYQAAWADVDNDGDLDLATDGQIFRNNLNNSNRWLKVRLEGDGKTVNRAAIGAQVRAFVGGQIISRQVNTGTGQGNQNDLTLHFGLGKHSGKVRIKVTWPGGKVDTLNVATNQTIDVRFGKPNTETGKNDVSAQIIAADAAYVYWAQTTSNDGDPVSYKLQYRKENKSDSWSDSISSNATSAVLNGLNKNTAYRIRIRTLEGNKTGQWVKQNNLFDTGTFKAQTQAIGEVGHLTSVTHEVQTITFDHSFINPVVFAQSPSNSGVEPVALRINDVQPNRFSIYLEEPSNDDGQHKGISVSYVVVESGTHKLVDGRQLEVGTVITDATVGAGLPKVWETVSFATPFSRRPVILSQIQTHAGADFLNVRQNLGNKKQFNLALQPEEAVTNSQKAETVGYLAVESGAGWSGLPLDAHTSSKDVNNNWYNLQFNQIYHSPPQFLSSLATSGVIDNANLRYRKLKAGEVQIRVQEDTTADKETKHGKEKVSYLAIAGKGLILADDSPEPPTEPGMPTIGDVGTDSAVIQWDEATDPNGDPLTYKIQFRKNRGNAAWSSSIATADTSLTLTELEDNTTYDVKVQASDGTTHSKWVIAEGLFTTDLFLGDTAVVGEVGYLTNVTHEVQTITLNRTFASPVVFAQSPSNAGVGPVALRVSDVQADQFTIYLAEPSNEDGIHNKAVKVTYLVLEAGSHELVDGKRLKVGTVQTNAAVRSGDFFMDRITFDTAFTSRPVILSQIQTHAGETFLYTRQDLGTATGFRIALQQEEAATQTPTAETVGYLALEPGTGWSGLPFEAYTATRISADWRTIQYQQSYDAKPSLLSSLATVNIPDSANLRYRKATAASVQIKIQEDTTADNEVAHGKEKVSYLAIGGNGQILARYNTPPPTDPAPPAAPGPPTATVIGPNSALLEWTASSDPNKDPITYEVQYRKNNRSQAWSEVFTTSEASFTLSGLDAATIYRVKIRAHDGALFSEWIKVNELFRTPCAGQPYLCLLPDRI